MSSEIMVQANNITKFYGEYPAISNVSFTANKGEIIGFLGPNGSGKTTTMRILTGYMPASSGDATIAGYDVANQSLEAKQHVGYLPENAPLYTDMKVNEYLSFTGKIRGMTKTAIKSRLDEIIEICRLQEYRNTIIGKLSKGFRQRVGIAQAIIHQPDVLILDEPTIGIDPIQVVETRSLIKEIGGDSTIILSSHILPEVSAICERVIIINDGEIVAVDSPENLSNRLEATERIRIEALGKTSDMVSVFRNNPSVQDVNFETLDDGKIIFDIISKGGLEIRSELAKSVIDNGWSLYNLQAVSLSLEDIFLRLTTNEEEIFEEKK